MRSGVVACTPSTSWTSPGSRPRRPLATRSLRIRSCPSVAKTVSGGTCWWEPGRRIIGAPASHPALSSVTTCPSGTTSRMARARSSWVSGRSRVGVHPLEQAANAPALHERTQQRSRYAACSRARERERPVVGEVERSSEVGQRHRQMIGDPAGACPRDPQARTARRAASRTDAPPRAPDAPPRAPHAPPRATRAASPATRAASAARRAASARQAGRVGQVVRLWSPPESSSRKVEAQWATSFSLTVLRIARIRRVSSLGSAFEAWSIWAFMPLMS